MRPSHLRIVALAASLQIAAAVPSPAGLKSDVTILISNDLQGPSSSLASSGVVLLDGPLTNGDASAGCEALGEQLWSPELNTASIQKSLDYLALRNGPAGASLFWIAPKDSQARTISITGELKTAADSAATLPVLCTQTAPFSNETFQDVSAKWQITTKSNGDSFVGYRDRLSFRFLGVRYAPAPTRFTYSVGYKGTGQTVQATGFGSQCAQGTNTGSEDCLFLNIYTPYMPSTGPGTGSPPAAKSKLRPVMFWIHGGAFTGGTANDATMDGGSLASRGDVVLVNINYRLSTLGFLALKDGVTNGNFGLADQVTALDWVRANIADFGGDPDRITIFGQSAGAGSVRALMASPKAEGKFAAAIMLSNLGGINYGTTYSKYYTIDQEVAAAANAILNATGCAAAASQVECLRAVPPFKLTGASTVARFLVVDGVYLTSDELDVTTTSLGPLGVKLMMGIMHDDGAPFITYPTTANASAYLAGQGFTSVPPPADFPIPPAGSNDTLALYNMTSRLATDGIFRCVDQATVAAGLTSGRLIGPQPSAGVYYYEFDRSYQTTGWPKTDVCEAPRTASRPFGDPSLPYFRCHSGELYYVFGNLARQGLPARDEHDAPFEQFVLDAFAAFARAGDPNPDEAFLAARGYDGTLAEVRRSRWTPAAMQGGAVGQGTQGLSMRVLRWPEPYQAPFAEMQQCASLGLGLDYYMPGQGAREGWRRPN